MQTACRSPSRNPLELSSHHPTTSASSVDAATASAATASASAATASGLHLHGGLGTDLLHRCSRRAITAGLGCATAGAVIAAFGTRAALGAAVALGLRGLIGSRPRQCLVVGFGRVVATATEQRLRGTTCHDRISDLIRIALVRITSHAEATIDMDASTLLHDVGCFMRGRVQIGCITERDVIASRVRDRSHVLARPRCGAADVSFDPANFVATEQSLDAIGVGELGARPGDAARRRGLHVLRATAPCPCRRITGRARPRRDLALHYGRRWDIEQCAARDSAWNGLGTASNSYRRRISSGHERAVHIPPLSL
jgi:hypothetical protein